MTTRFWIGAAVGAIVAWYFFTPHGNGGTAPGVGGGRPQRPSGKGGRSFGRR